jgi:hypothetical protein
VVFSFLVFCSHAFQVADAVKRYSYLLGQTDLFRHFVDVQVRLSLCFTLSPNFMFTLTFREHATLTTQLYLTQSLRLRGEVGKGGRESIIPLSFFSISLVIY